MKAKSDSLQKAKATLQRKRASTSTFLRNSILFGAVIGALAAPVALGAASTSTSQSVRETKEATDAALVASHEVVVSAESALAKAKTGEAKVKAADEKAALALTNIEGEKPKEEPVAGSLVWLANPSQPILNEWANELAAETSRVRDVADSTVFGGHALEVEIRSGDNAGGTGERAEVAMGNAERAGFPTFSEGEDVWIAVPLKFVGSYPLAGSHSNWNTVLQLHEKGGPGSPPLALHEENDSLTVMHNTCAGCSNKQIGSIMSGISAERWQKIVLHVHFSTSTSVGFVEIYGGVNEGAVTQQLPKTFVALLFGGFEPTHLRIGTYRGNWSPRPTALTRYGRLAIASTRELAEKEAFG